MCWSPTWAQGVDGRWSALDGTALYNTSRAARLSAWIYATVAQAVELGERHGTRIRLRTETVNDPEHDLLVRMHTSGAKTLVTVDDADAARISERAGTVSITELRQLAMDARDAEQSAAATIVDPAELRAVYHRAVAARNHLDEGDGCALWIATSSAT